jgi:hypothetical protein
MNCTVFKSAGKVCGKKSTVFVEVSYKNLYPYREKEGKYQDIFGLCCDHGKKLLDPSAWNQARQMIGQRGIVQSVNVLGKDVDHSENAKEDRRLRKLAAIKSNIIQIMSRGNASEISIEHWRKTFDEVLAEWVICGVHDG